jgi:hypothetical protein
VQITSLALCQHKTDHPSAQGGRYRTVTTQTRTARCSPQSNIELMPEKEVLDFKPAPRLEQVGAKIPKQLKECEHRAG